MCAIIKALGDLPKYWRVLLFWEVVHIVCVYERIANKLKKKKKGKIILVIIHFVYNPFEIIYFRIYLIMKLFH